MKVYLAGYNVDTTTLEELGKDSPKPQPLTPEVISAAYARISRDPRPINEIRKDARSEVERSRRSNKTIIFKMGHHSVAEHAVFNLDVLGISRLAMEELEKFRLCSYTEKSQRYITLDKGFIIPEEIKGTNVESTFVDIINEQNDAYAKLFEELKEYVFKKYSALSSEGKNHSLLEGWAKEDARYITSLATSSQVGQTINARNLELLLRRFASHSLREVRNLGRAIYEQIVNVAPSVIIFHKANDYDRKTYHQLKILAGEIIRDKENISSAAGEDVRLVEFTQEGDIIIAASLLHTSSSIPYEECKVIVKRLSQEEKRNIFKTACGNMQFYDSVLREFEYVNFTFNIVLSAACFGQLKRHRMATITAQNYEPCLGVTVPQSIKDIGRERKFREIIGRTNEAYKTIYKVCPLVATYVLTNAHRRRVLIRVNVRELYHISRLREDSRAQWDIRNISRAMSSQAERVMPLAFMLIGGKDKYNELYQNIYGSLPEVTKAVLPGARKIKQ